MNKVGNASAVVEFIFWLGQMDNKYVQCQVMIKGDRGLSFLKG